MSKKITSETATLIAKGTDRPQCSSGEYHVSQFIKSCVDYVTRANMREVIFDVDMNIIKEIIEMAVGFEKHDGSYLSVGVPLELMEFKSIFSKNKTLNVII